MVERLILLLSFIVERLQSALRLREQQRAQDDRDEIENDSAQYAADQFGDGRVRKLSADAAEADKAKRADGDGR